MRATTRPITVASVPAGHVYVRHLAGVEDDGEVARLPDPPGRDAGPTGAWWPPAMLDPAWIEENADAFDLMHVHFGFDALSPADLREVVAALRRAGRPLVQTVHDLRNPHHPDRTLHDEQLDVLLPAADALITLTSGAASEIERRWGREAVVVPHAHVVPLDRMAAARRRDPADGFRVGLHVKSLRACMDPVAILPALAEAVRAVPGGVLRVDGHTDVLGEGQPRRDEALVAVLEEHADVVELHVHDYFDDDELHDYLESLDVSVLPYRFGTHSGWMEACRDLGTRVVAPTCGHYADQGPVHPYVLDEDRFEPESLVAAVLSAHAAGPAQPADPAWRQAQREDVVAAHRAVYRSVLVP